MRRIILALTLWLIASPLLAQNPMPPGFNGQGKQWTSGSSCPPTVAPVGGAGGMFTCSTTGALYTYNGSAWEVGTAGGPGTGTDTQILYNSSGNVAGDANLTWNGTTLTANGLFSQTVSTTTRVMHHIENDAPDSASNLNIVGYDTYIATNSSNTHNQTSIKGADMVGEHDGSGTLAFLGGLDGDAESYSSALVDTLVGVRGLADNNSSGGATWLSGVRSVFGNDGSGSTVADASGVDVREIGGSGTVTRNYGVYVPDLAQGASNYGFYSAQSSGATKFAFYAAGTAGSHFGGDVDLANGVALKGDATTGHTYVFKVYDNDTGPAYVSWLTATNGNTPGIVIAPPTGGTTISVQATTYKSSDGSTGATVSVCSSFKNGLCVAGT